jgi:hypothetical protein
MPFFESKLYWAGAALCCMGFYFQWKLLSLPEEMLSESEKRHEKYRRRQAMAGRFPPAAERLPIMTAEEREERDKLRPKWTQTQFEGPIEKLIEKYGDAFDVCGNKDFHRSLSSKSRFVGLMGGLTRRQ